MFDYSGSIKRSLKLLKRLYVLVFHKELFCGRGRISGRPTKGLYMTTLRS